ncbi:hypothetical protein G6F35_017162 [Rhizopus arrhizus]|nr:hypothetical protein G6F35_017162 [Rhizopus arrhizus]
MRWLGHGGVLKIQPAVTQGQLRDADRAICPRFAIAAGACVQRRLQGGGNVHFAIGAAHDRKIEAFDHDGVEYGLMAQKGRPLRFQHNAFGACTRLARGAGHLHVGQHDLPPTDLHVAHLATGPQHA